MEKLGDAIRTKNTIAIENKELNPIAIVEVKLSYKEVESLLQEISDLEVSPSFKGYCVNRLKVIGPTAFLEAADYSRKYGKWKDRCFIQKIKAV